MEEEGEGGELDYLQDLLREELAKHQFAVRDFAITIDDGDEAGYILTLGFYFDENIVVLPKPAKTKKIKLQAPTGPLEGTYNLAPKSFLIIFLFMVRVCVVVVSGDGGEWVMTGGWWRGVLCW